MKLLNLLNKNILNEVSEKVKNQLYSKFKDDTSDSREMIMSNIDLFDRYKESLPSDKRDITKYSYNELKSFVDSKQSAKAISDIFKQFKKKEKGIENNTLTKYIKKFLEIKSEIPKEFQDINKLTYLQLVKLIDRGYYQLLNQKMIKKFSEENPNLTKEQIIFYLNNYNENFDLIPFETKGIDKMSFSELEHLLDGLEGKKESNGNDKQDVEDIDLKYDQNNLKIFAPKTKDQCIRLKNGRGWCTSREGSGNMYYNYRLGNERTLYYVIDEDKSFDDLNFATVILVDPNGRKSMADKSNSGKYGGSTNLPWDEIVSKVPKLEGLEDIFKPEPLTQEEKELINIVRNARVGDNPMESFENPQQVEMWLEYNSPNLSDVQYSNLTPNLKKKYIALGMNLSSSMINSSEPEVLKYYITKKIDLIKGSDISRLSGEDIALLNTPMLKKVKEELKPKFVSSVTVNNGEKLVIDSFTNGPIGKFISLYGLEDLFKSLPLTLKEFQIQNTNAQNNIIITIPEDIGKFKELNFILLNNCVDSIPDSICNLPKLRFITLSNNTQLNSIPDCISNLPSLLFLNLRGCPNVEVPQSIREKGTDMGNGMWDLEND
jgi:hypothetical protein